MNPWSLPRTAVIGGREYPINADFRDILEILSWLDDRSKPEFLRWQVALALFYEGQLPPDHRREAMEYLADFLTAGSRRDKPGARELDWQQDAPLIIADINRVAGREVRTEKFLHWWTFLGWFHSIGQGQLSTVVALRRKLRRGQKLERWEQEFYRENKHLVELPKQLTPAEQAEVRRLQALLDT